LSGLPAPAQPPARRPPRRTFDTRFGSITVKRTRGYCKRGHKWRVPADAALGLDASAGYMPAVQEMAALLASKMPVEVASLMPDHLTGFRAPALLRSASRRMARPPERNPNPGII
jgi:hypothetical protein